MEMQSTIFYLIFKLNSHLYIATQGMSDSKYSWTCQPGYDFDIYHIYSSIGIT